MNREESEQRFRSLMESSPDNIIQYDIHCKAVYNNQRLKDTVQITEKILGKNPLEAKPENSIGIEIYFRKLQRVIKTGEPDETDIIVPDTLGHMKTHHIRFAAERRADGKIIGAFAFGRDVTIERETERAAAERRAELELLSRISKSLRNTCSREDMMSAILEQIVSLIKEDGAAFAIHDPLSGDIIIEMAYGEMSPAVGHRMNRGEGISSYVIRTGRSYITGSAEHELYEAESDLNKFCKNTACVPLIINDETLGALWIGRAISILDHDLNFLLSIADIAASAIKRITLHERTLQIAMELAAAYETTLEGWSRALDLKDSETHGHSQRVTELTLLLARKAGIEGEDLVHIKRGALLHDIGKMGIPDKILLKPDALTEEEWDTMRKHTVYANELLSSIEYLAQAKDIPYCHHERWDGNGYPQGLKGDEIPLSARLFAVVDVWDALRSDRPYRPGWPDEKVLQYLNDHTGTHFDPQIVHLFIKLLEENIDDPGN
jgi:PAS domain S-box-containing protein/putative nucleotidyltransferase with HDIG domain